MTPFEKNRSVQESILSWTDRFFSKGVIHMNKIYKVIWSKVKHCWVVVSEIAGNHGKTGNAGGMAVRALLAALLLTGSTGIGMTVEAAVKGEPAAVQAETKADDTKKADTEQTAEEELLLKAGSVDAASTGEPSKDENNNLTWGSGAGIPGGTTENPTKNSVAIGTNATVYTSNSVAIGNGATIAQFDNGEGNNVAIGNMAGTSGQNAVAIGSGAKASADHAVAFGGNASATQGSTAIGGHVNANNTSIAIGSYDTNGTSANGISNTSATGVHAIAIGYQTSASAGANNDGKGNALAIGTSANVTANDGIAIGAHAENKAGGVDGGVALGSYSAVDTDRTVGSNFYVGYDPATGQAATNTSPVWKATKGAVSVGAWGEGDQEITRQITHVAAGTKDSDAVNVAQLKSLHDAMENAGKLAHDYSLIANPEENSNGKYTVDANGDVTLKVKDSVSGDTKDVTISGLGTGSGEGGAWNLTTNGDTAHKTTIGKDATVDMSGAKDTVQVDKNGNPTEETGDEHQNITVTKTDKADGTDVSYQLSDVLHVGTSQGDKTITIDGKKGEITGLTNRTWTQYDYDTLVDNKPVNIYADSGKAVTEAQLRQALENLPEQIQMTESSNGIWGGILVKPAGAVIHDVSNRSIAMGNGAVIYGGTTNKENASDNIAMGGYATISKDHESEYDYEAEGNVVIGAYASAVGKNQGNIGYRHPHGTDNVEYYDKPDYDIDEATVIGMGAKSEMSYSTALGAHSLVSREDYIGNGDVVNGFKDDAAPDGTMGVVSVGNSRGYEDLPDPDRHNQTDSYTRRIINVSRGQINEKSTDAINGSQLYRALASSIQYDRKDPNDKNILPLKPEDINKTSITLNKGGDATTIHNVNAGTKDTDAVNVSQMKTYTSTNDMSLQNGTANVSGLTVKDTVNGKISDTVVSTGYKADDKGNVIMQVKDQNADGQENIRNVVITDVASKAQQDKNTTNITNLGEKLEGAVMYNTKEENGKTVVDKDNITLGGTEYTTKTENGTTTHDGGTKITNVAYAKDSEGSAAVNVDKLKDYVAANGGGSWNLTANGADSKEIKKGNTVDFTGANGVKVSKENTDNGTNVTVGLSSKITVGKDGEKGEQGEIGLAGKPGADGKAGITTIRTETGKAGVDGVDGKDGITRIIYKDPAGKDHQVATFDDGLKFKGDINDAQGVKLNKQVNIVGGQTDSAKLSDGKNIGVVTGTVGEDGNLQLDVKLAKELTGLTSVTIGGAIDGKPGTGAVIINNEGINAGGKVITNAGTTTGTNVNDVVNVEYLNQKLQGFSGTDYRLIANPKEGSEGKYTVNSKGELELIVQNGDKTDDRETVTIGGIAVVYDEKDNLISTNSNQQNWKNVEGTVALGKGSLAQSNSVALGDKAIVYEAQGIALGNGAHAGKKGISIGYHANGNFDGGRAGAIAIGNDTQSLGLYSTVIGTNSTVSGDLNTTYPTLFGGKHVQGAVSTVLGAQNKVDNGAGKVFAGVANSVAGAANTITDSNGVTIQGTGNTVTNAYQDMNLDWSDLAKIATGDYSVLADKDSGAVAVIGGANTISNQTDSTIIGYGNTVKGDDGSGKTSSDIFMAGSQNTLTGVSNAVVLGNEVQMANVNDVISLGNQNSVSASKAVALGSHTYVRAEGGVALGEGSEANVGAGVVGYLAPQGNQSPAWKSTTGAVSVGDQDMSRQITNVAAGTKDGDAVNVAQLKAVETMAKNAGTEWNLTTGGDADNKATIGKGNTVDFTGANGVKVSKENTADGAKVTVGLDNQITLGEAGKDGADGKDGSITIIHDNKETTITLNGKDGKPGVDGKDGITRIEYADKDGNKQEVATLNDGLKFKGDDDTVIAKKLNEQLDIVGGADSTKLSDNNIGVVSDENGKLHVKLSSEITGMNKIEMSENYQVTTDNSVTNKKYVDETVANAGWNLTTNGGTAEADKAQLIKKDQTVDFSAEDGLTISKETADKGANVKVGLGDKITVGDNGIVIGQQKVTGNGEGAKEEEGKYVTGLTNKDWNKDNIVSGRAATEDQLKEAVSSINTDMNNKTFGLSDDKGATVTNTLDKTVSVKGADGITSTVVDKDGSKYLEIGLGDTLTVGSGKDGKDGKDGSITIINKDGTQGTIGINGKDGKDGVTRIIYTTKDDNGNDVKHEVATLDDGLKFKGDDETVITKKLNDQLDIVGGADRAKLSDNNIGVVSDENGKLHVKLSSEITGMNKIEMSENYQVTTDNSVTNKKYVDDRITNMNTDLTNKGLIFGANSGDDYKAALGTKVTIKGADSNKDVDDSKFDSGKNVKTKVDENGNILIMMANDLTGNSFTAGNTVINNSGLTIGGKGDSNQIIIHQSNVSMGGNVIHNVGKGEVDTDAVNKGQLDSAIEGAKGADKSLVQGAGKGGDANKTYDKVTESGDVTLRVEDSKGNGHDVTISNVASKEELDKVKTDVGDLNYVEGGKGNVVTNGESVTTSIGKLDQAIGEAAEAAKQHSSVSVGNGLTLDASKKNVNGGTDYKVSLSDNFTVGDANGKHVSVNGTEGNITATGTVTAGSVVINGMNKDGKPMGTVSGLSNTTWDSKLVDKDAAEGGYKGSTNAATESQLQQAMAGAVQYDRKDDGTVDNTHITLNKGGDAVTITNVADGKVEEGSKDAVNGGQLYNVQQQVNSNQMAITNVAGSVTRLSSRVNKVGAGAAALAALHPLDFDPDDKWDFAAGYGNYAGANAVAVGMYYRPNEDTMFSVGGSMGGGENMVNAGVSFKLGQGNHVSTSRVAMAKEIKDLRAVVAAQGAQIQQLVSLVGELTGKRTVQENLADPVFPDVPENHWAYEYVKGLAEQGVITGYPAGNFGGDRTMTRYEFAAMLYRALEKGVKIPAGLEAEFHMELERFRVDTVAKDKDGRPAIERVRVVKGK